MMHRFTSRIHQRRRTKSFTTSTNHLRRSRRLPLPRPISPSSSSSESLISLHILNLCKQGLFVSARVTQMPTLRELDDLFGELPELPPPLPRQRHPQQGAQPARNQLPPAPPTPTTLWSWISSWVLPETPSPPPRRPNPFAALKAGKRIVVIAAVDAGNISFFRFGQGGFEDWPMM